MTPIAINGRCAGGLGDLARNTQQDRRQDPRVVNVKIGEQLNTKVDAYLWHTCMPIAIVTFRGRHLSPTSVSDSRRTPYKVQIARNSLTQADSYA